MKIHRILLLLICCALYGTIFYLSGLESTFAPAELSKVLAPKVMTEWFSVVNQSHNAFHQWRLDSGLISVLYLFRGFRAAPVIYYQITCWFIFLCGTVCLFQYISPSRNCFSSLLSGMLLSGMILFLWGGDTVILSSFAWLPFFILLLCLATNLKNSSLSIIIISLFLLLRILKSANQLSLLVLTSAVIAAICFVRSRELSPRLSQYIFLIILFVPTVIILFLVPDLNFPDYPELAHVVQYDGLPGMIRPLVGPAAPVPVVDRAYIHNTYAAPALLIFIITSLLPFVFYNVIRKNLFFLFFSLISGLVVLDTVIPEIISHILPLSTVSRLIPGFFYFPLAPFFLVAALFLIFLYSEKKGGYLHCFCSLGVLALYFLPLLVLGSPFTIQTAVFQDKNGLKTRRDYQVLLKDLRGNQEGYKKLQDLVVSPSFSLFKKEGFWSLGKTSVIEKGKFKSPTRPPHELQFKATSSHNNTDELKKIYDRRLRSRWTAGRGRQTGDEWIQISLEESVTLHGLALELGRKFLADFPRGIRISFKAKCEESISPKDQTGFEEVIEIPEWEGPINITPRGFYYYGGQSAVRVYFPKPVTGACFLAEQIGLSNRVDWSVSELKFLFFPFEEDEDTKDD